MYIEYSKKGDTEYATVTSSVRNGNRITKGKDGFYLGKVIDKQRGIYQSRERGTFMYDLATGEFGEADLALVPKKRLRGKEKLIVDFGDAYFLDTYMRSRMFSDCVEKCRCRNNDTFMAMVVYTILCADSRCNAQVWYEGSYARLLYPKADLDGRRISDFLKAIGDESIQRAFFEQYIPFVKRGVRTLGVAVDSSGAPNSIHIPLTAVSNHNGDISEEVRVIFVIRLDNKMPVFIRCVPGNVPDSSTLIRTVEELKLMGIDISDVVIDAGYCTLKNLEDLYEGRINFVTRLKPNLELYKNAVRDHIDELERNENIVSYGNRLAYIVRERCEPVEGHEGYAYIVKDMDRKKIDDDKTRRDLIDEVITPSQAHEQLRRNGIFVLVSTNSLAIEDVLPTYYARQEIEQFIDMSKNYANMVPPGVHSVEALRGSILLTFIASSVIQSIMNELTSTDMNLKWVFSVLRNQKCKVFDEVTLTDENTANANKVYNIFGFKPEIAIPIPKRV